MKRFAIAASVLAIAVGSAIGQAQQPQQTPPGQMPRMQTPGAEGKHQGQGMHDMKTPKTTAEMKQACEKTMQEMQAMKTECDRADQQLDQQVQKIKQAKGDAKIDAIAMAVETMAQQRQQTRERSEVAMPKMMQHMQMHAAMAAENPQQGQQAMAQCPMMKPSESARPAGQQLP